MDFFGYEICDKWIWTSDKIRINKNTITKHDIPKSNTNMTSPSEKLGFGCYPYKSTCDILSENLVSQILQAYSSINDGDVLRYINRVKSGHGIGIPKTCGYQYCGKKAGFMLYICLINIILYCR